LHEILRTVVAPANSIRSSENPACVATRRFGTFHDDMCHRALPTGAIADWATILSQIFFEAMRYMAFRLVTKL